VSKRASFPNTSTASAPPDAGSTPELTELLDELSRLQELDEDWDLDGAHRIDEEAIRSAAWLVRMVEKTARQRGLPWSPPEIGPVPDGSVALTWEGDGRQTLTILRSGHASTVECVVKEEGASPIRQVVPRPEAVRVALWALGGE
jgi:hypothetical protein